MVAKNAKAPATDDAVNRDQDREQAGKPLDFEPTSPDLPIQASTGARQVETSRCTVEEIMSSPMFARGVEDRRAGRPYSDVSAIDDPTWSYERGRQWASIAPRSLRLRLKGRLNPEAIEFFVDAGDLIR